MERIAFRIEKSAGKKKKKKKKKKGKKEKLHTFSNFSIGS